MEEIELKVAEARSRDVGRRIARIGAGRMKEMGLTSGDVVELEGESRASAIAWPGYSADPEDIVRVDGSIRNSAGARIGDRVKIRRIETQRAEKVVVAPTQPVRIVGGTEYLRRLLEGRPVSSGQVFRVAFMGRRVDLKVVSTKPQGTVIPGRNTEIDLREEPMEEAPIAPNVTYEDIGGLEDELHRVREMIELPLKKPELFQKLGIEPPKGVILHGPPGTGKTLIAKAVANEADAYFQSIRGPEIMSKYYGESEKKLREIFDEAEENAPAIIFVDEIDSIAPKRAEVGGEVERRVVSQLLTLLDGLEARGEVVVIAATNQINQIDPALRRPGRFDREIEIGVPDQGGRREILEIHTRGMPLSEEVSLVEFAKKTHGFVGADLESLAKEAAMNSLRDLMEEIDLEKEIPADVIEKLEISGEDFYEALRGIEPSAMREVFVEIPDVSWEDIGGLDELKRELRESVEWPTLYPEAFEAVATEPPRGVLLHGPPGTGKTLLAKAVANESEANFISVKGPELLSKWVGESEKAVRETFRKAKQSAPTVVFFDEIDALAPTRGGAGDSQVTERVISQLLTELDGMETRGDVVVIAATNRPDLVDPALLRQGRLERHLEVGAPDEEARKEIFLIHTTGMPLGDGVELEDLAERTEGYVGSDIAGVAKRAAMLALRQNIGPDETREEVREKSKGIKVEKEHFDEAIEEAESARSRGELRSHMEATEKLRRGENGQEVV
ncbi:MAG: VCP-like ATPase [Methanonatronarchaeales archaeon]|nr:VCP-like ATPase [Methanonatronarchaeales archaeon]